MVMQPWNPFRDLRRMDEMMNQLWRGIGSDNSVGSEQWSLAVDVIEDEDKILVNASVPGIKPEDINVTIEDNVLTIKGETATSHEVNEEHYRLRERRYGSFHRTLRLPDTVDTDKAATRYENGVLTITLPKVEAKKAKRLPVTVENNDMTGE